MFLTNGQLFLNFDKLIDVDSVLNMKPWLSAFVARNFHLIEPCRYHQKNLWTQDTALLDLSQAWQAKNSGDQVYKFVDNKQLHRWLMFEQDLAVGNFMINLRPWVTHWTQRHLAAHCAAIAEDAQLTDFYHWLDNQKIFEQYGSVKIFINFQHTGTLTHRDYVDLNEPSKDEFIWLGFSPHKHLYIFDPESQTKVYATGIANYFNTNNWHGSGPSPFACYSIRVDGIFSDQFKQRMAESQRPSRVS